MFDMGKGAGCMGFFNKEVVVIVVVGGFFNGFLVLSNRV